MQKYLFDKEIVANQLSVLINTLNSQRQNKKTLLSYLEKFSNAMYDNFNSENTDLLLSLINEAHSVFECIKSNISKTLELKNFLENIYQSDCLNSIDAEKFNTEFNLLLENISKTNSNYLTFMNNYENFISQNLKDNIVESIIQNATIQTSTPSNSSATADTNNALENSLSNIENISETLQETPKIEIISEPINSLNETNNTLIEKNILSDESDNFLDENNDSPDEKNNFSNEDNNSSEETNNTKIEDISSETQSNDNNYETEENINNETYFSTYLQEKVLIINRKAGIAILPYSISDLDELFLDNPEKYSSIQDIIDKEYTISLDEYENTSISRYKEAFKLAKEKSNYSFSQAANFAKNLLIENKATTLIIAACKNVDELEYYLDCLNKDHLESFTSFKIIEK